MITKITETLRLINRYKANLTIQQYKTLIGQAKSGDTEGAKKGLYRLLERGKMAEYIDRNELIKNLNKFAPEQYSALVNMIITKQPAVDVGKVVRCKDCKHYVTDDIIPNYCNYHTNKVGFCDDAVYMGEYMQEIINCVSCGRELQYGDTYCSNVYYTINGLWSYAECPECYEKNREKYLNRKGGKK